MTELQNCLPEQARPFFFRLRNSKWEESRQSYTAKLAASRSEAAAKGVLKSGFQIKIEWDLTVSHMGDLAFGYFEAAIETCTLYDITLTRSLCDCIGTAVEDFLRAQQRNAMNNAASNVPGALPIPLSSRQQLSNHSQSLPRYNEIMIALERARVESEKAGVQKAASAEAKGEMVTISKEQREGDRPDVLNVLIASPSDVNDERDAVTTAIHDWNAVNANPDTINILLHPIRWETHSYPESGDRPQALLNRQIVTRGDFLIGIFGTRLGTPTGVAESGTIEEIEQFRKAGKYVALYFSNAPIPRNTDREQLDALNQYKQARQKDTKYEVFSSADDLRRQISQHLTGIVMSVAKPLQLGMWRNESSKFPKINALTGTPVAEPEKPKSDLARLNLRIGLGARSGDVNTVKVVAEITNLSPSVRIREYSVTVSVPAACLTFQSAQYPSEIQSEMLGRRRFRHTEKHFSGVPIHPGDSLQVFSLDLGIDQLKMVGTYLAGDFEGTLADKIVADAVVDGESLHVERSVAEVFQEVLGR